MRLARYAPLFGLFALACSSAPSTPGEAPVVPVPEEDKPKETQPATTEKLDETDLVAFDRLALAVRTSKAASDAIFVEPANNQRYELHELPIYWLRRTDKGANERGYLVGFPSPRGTRVEHPALAELGPVHRWDKDIDVLPEDAPFGFAEPVAGTKAFVYPYRPESGDFDPAVPSTPDFFAMFVHEGFHRYQTEEGGWIDPPNWTQDEASYPLTRENLALVLLEHRVLVAGLTAKDVAAKETALKQLAAIRAARIKLPTSVVNGVNFVESLDLPQELVEGTANYVELHFLQQAGQLDAAGALEQRVSWLEGLFDVKAYETIDDVRAELAFGRFYPTGSALSELLDEVGGIDWRSPCKQAVSQYATIVKKYPTAIGAEADALLAAAKSAHELDAKILPVTDKLLALPKGGAGKLRHAKKHAGCRHPQ